MGKILFDLKVRLASPITIISWILASVACTFAGPFNTYSIDTLGFRAFFWSSVLLVSVVASQGITVTYRHCFPRWSILKLAVIACVTFTFAYWLFIWGTITVIYDDQVLPQPLMVLALIAAVAVAIFAIIYLVSPNTLQPDAGASVENTQTARIELPEDSGNRNGNTFLQRLGPDAGSRLIRLAMRDHYIEAYTEHGLRTLHMRFADALRELEGINGDQIHRSHWINFDEIKGVVKDGGKIGFEMSDGFIAPVARSRKPELKQRGLL
ncbi:MAG: LytTR family transcriptional regulator [Rhodobacteraceae bacterium]|nr:LytTR family transcriptional regulator [Paracoccaceae bacterium]